MTKRKRISPDALDASLAPKQRKPMVPCWRRQVRFAHLTPSFVALRASRIHLAQPCASRAN